jgi:hypothetical protein
VVEGALAETLRARVGEVDAAAGRWHAGALI